MTALIRVQSVEPLEECYVRILFTNGEKRDIDLTPYMASGAIFEPVRTDKAYFQKAFVDGGTIAWPNGADIDPDVLYYAGPPPWVEKSSVAAQAKL